MNWKERLKKFEPMRKFIRQALHSARPGICEDVAVWGRKNGLKVLEIHKPTYDKILPLVLEDATARSEFDFHEADYRRPQSLVVVPKARVRDAVGFVFLSDGSVCYQGNWVRSYLTQNLSYQARFRKKRFLKGNVFSLLGLWSGEFYHWFHDTLPRLLTALPHLPSDIKFLVNEKSHAYQLDSLSALGIGPERLELQPNQVDTVTESLWFATPLGHSTIGAGDVIKQLALKLQNGFNVQRNQKISDRIYISRQKARCRRVCNELAILPRLCGAGFKIVVCEDLSLADQVKLFINASCVLGPHGAGLTNMIFCAEGTRIGEIICGKEPRPCFLVMSRQLGFHFYRFTARSKKIPEDGEGMELDPNCFASEFKEFVHQT